MTARITDLTQVRLSRQYAEMVADGVPPIPTGHLSVVDKTPRSVVERQIEFAEEYQRDYGDVPAGVALVEYFRERGDLFVAVCAGAALGMLATVGLAYVWRLFL